MTNHPSRKKIGVLKSSNDRMNTDGAMTIDAMIASLRERAPKSQRARRTLAEYELWSADREEWLRSLLSVREWGEAGEAGLAYRDGARRRLRGEEAVPPAYSYHLSGPEIPDRVAGAVSAWHWCGYALGPDGYAVPHCCGGARCQRLVMNFGYAAAQCGLPASEYRIVNGIWCPPETPAKVRVAAERARAAEEALHTEYLAGLMVHASA